MTVVICRIQYRSASVASQANCGSGSASLLRDWRSRSSSTRDMCRNFPDFIFRAPHQACKQAARCLTKSFKVLSCAFTHGNNHGASHVEKIREVRGEIRNVVR